MKVELTSSQINELYAFVEKKKIKPLDVQIELVDHLASDIENLLSSSTELTFEEALEKVYAKFGRWGFGDLVEQAEKNVRKRQKKMFWTLFQSFFRWPKALFTITLSIVLWWGFDKGYLSKDIKEEVALSVGFLLIGYFLFSVVRHQRMKHKLTLTNPPSWVGLCGQLPTFLNLFLGSFFQEGFTPEVYSIWATILITLSILLTWATIEVYERMLTESRRLYPQAFA